ASDRITDLLLGWLNHEMGKDPAFPKLRRFIDENLRHDLQTLALLAWRRQAQHHEGDTSDRDMETAMLAAQYLSERGYFKMEDARRVARAIERSQIEAGLELVARWVARRMEVPDDQPLPASLAFLTNPDRAQGSLATYLSGTAEHRQAADAFTTGE